MNKKGLILISIGCTLILIAGIMVNYNYYSNQKAGVESKKIYEKIQNNEIAVKEDIKEDKEMTIVNIDGNDYIGSLYIPALNLEIPIMADWDYNKMKISSCRYYGSIFTNDLVLCAHAYDNLFGKIKELNSGDILILTDMNKEEYIYKVEVIEILSPDDVQEMIESEFDLTLYTCTMDSLNRVTVRLNRA